MSKDSRDESAAGGRRWVIPALRQAPSWYLFADTTRGKKSETNRRHHRARCRFLFALAPTLFFTLETHAQFMRMQFIHIARRRVFLAAANKFPFASTFYTLMAWLIFNHHKFSCWLQPRRDQERVLPLLSAVGPLEPQRKSYARAERVYWKSCLPMGGMGAERRFPQIYTQMMKLGADGF